MTIDELKSAYRALLVRNVRKMSDRGGAPTDAMLDEMAGIADEYAASRVASAPNHAEEPVKRRNVTKITEKVPVSVSE
jgi:hypothetical protein